MSSEELSPAQLTAITSLITGANFNETAEAAGVSLMTLRRWRRGDTAFSRELQAQKKELLNQTTGQIANAAADSIAVMMEVRDDLGEAGAVRVRAASKLVDLAIQIGEMDVMQAEIDELRARLDAMGR